MLVGGDEVGDDVITLGMCFQCLFTFAFVSALRRLVKIWQLSRQGAIGELDVEFKFQRLSCKLSFLSLPLTSARAPQRCPVCPVKSELARANWSFHPALSRFAQWHRTLYNSVKMLMAISMCCRWNVGKLHLSFTFWLLNLWYKLAMYFI